MSETPDTTPETPTVQIILQNSNHETYDIDILPINEVCGYVQYKNKLFEQEGSQYRWRINGEPDEFNKKEKFNEVEKLLEVLIHEFRMRKIPLFVFVPLGHRLGGIWDSYICSLNSDLLPSCLKTVEKMFMGSAESNIDKNTNNERREFS
jgi:hypothetical protein